MALRLTLRTLLAYLDDTLEPTQARDIGQRIADNEPAQKLIERIRTVTRRRRITIPQSEGADGTNISPNEVAEYLDNTLSPDRVAEIERVCMESDANLAEVACVHQILSMVLGTPADVSAPMHRRLYALGGFGVSERAVHRKSRSKPAEVQPYRPKLAPSTLETQPLPLAIPAYGGRGGLAGKMTTLAAVACLLLALIVVISQVVSEPTGDRSILRLQGSSAQLRPGPADEKVNRADANTESDADKADKDESKSADDAKKSAAAKDSADKDKGSKTAGDAKGTNQSGEDQKSKAETAKKAKSDAAKTTAKSTVAEKSSPIPTDAKKATKADTKVALNTGKSAKAKAVDTPLVIDANVPLASFAAASRVLLRQNKDSFKRLDPKEYVYARDRLINLDGFRSVLELPSKSEIELVDQTKLDLKLGAADKVMSFDLLEGRVVLRSGDRPASFEIGLGSARVTVRLLNAQAHVGAEASLTAAAEPESFASRAVRLVVARGDVEVELGGATVALKGGDEIVAPVPFTAQPNSGGADWTRKGQDAIDARGAKLAGLLADSSGVETALREAAADRNKDTRRQAVKALAAIDEYQGVLTALADEKLADVRQAAIQAGRTMLQLDATRLDDVRAKLHVQYNEGHDADHMLELLIGFSDAAKRDVGTYETLVGLLESNVLPLRELAIYNLKDLTGRDFNYTADGSAMKRKTAVTQWRRWLAEQSTETLPARKTK